MFSRLQIVNLGLAKIAASRIERLDPPRTSLERHCSEGYEHWKRVEISKRRWVFAIEPDVRLTQTEYREYSKYKYGFALPTEALGPVRQNHSCWIQRGRSLWSNEPNLTVDLRMNVDEADFDPWFVEVLACRVARECVEHVTQSNSKTEAMASLYQEAVTEAGRANAFIIGPENYSSDDNGFPFLTERY